MACQQELDEVKELYVSVCRVKDDLEVKINKDSEVRLEQQLGELRETLTKEKEEEISELRQALNSSLEVSLATAREKWQKEQEEHVKKTVESEVFEKAKSESPLRITMMLCWT